MRLYIEKYTSKNINLFCRYIAVHFPLRRLYLQQKGRTLKYIIFVVVFSSLFSITRFFESQTVTIEESDRNNTITYNNTTIFLYPTELRLNPIYVKYYNWSRLIVYGVVPFVMLVYLNGLMYQDIKSRRKHWEYNNGMETNETEFDDYNDDDAVADKESIKQNRNDCIEMEVSCSTKTR